jgi:hypothetical protein
MTNRRPATRDEAAAAVDALHKVLARLPVQGSEKERIFSAVRGLQGLVASVALIGQDTP